MTEKKPIKTTIPEHEVMKPGHLACQGCGASLAMRYATKAIEGEAMFTLPACCWSVIDGPFPYSSLGLPLLHMAFEAAGATASGIRAALNMLGQKKVKVIAWGGDGGTFDIGFQAISGAAERDEDILYICYDNEAYMNTGIQRSSSTPRFARTTTTAVGPAKQGKQQNKKDLTEIMVAHGVPYAAQTAPIGNMRDLSLKARKAIYTEGPCFLNVLSPCPRGWEYPMEKLPEVVKAAVDTCVWPLYEVENGVWRLTYTPKQKLPVEEFLRLQGRFKHMFKPGNEWMIEEAQAWVDKKWDRLLELTGE